MVWLDTYHNKFGRLEIYQNDNKKVCKLFLGDSYMGTYFEDFTISNKKLADKYLTVKEPDNQLSFGFW